MIENKWSTVAIKCRAAKTKDLIIEFYGFMKDVVGVKDLYFIFRDRMDSDVILVFQVSMDPEKEKAVKSKIRYKLKRMMSEDDFLIEPDINHSLNKYSSPIMKRRQIDSTKYVALHNLLNQISRFMVDVTKANCFDSEDRAELVRVISMMLGCTEYGLLSTKEMEVGYYDRINDKYHTCLKESF
jgi:hypothetical protein